MIGQAQSEVADHRVHDSARRVWTEPNETPASMPSIRTTSLVGSEGCSANGGRPAVATIASNPVICAEFGTGPMPETNS